MSSAKREMYDLVFSLGSACSSTQLLRSAGLQFASFPFDWLLGPGPLARARLLSEEFAGWLDEAADFEALPNPNAFRHASWRNRRTGYSYLHDFEQGHSLTEQLPAVRAKYARRIARLLALIRCAQRVLVVWTGDPRDPERIADTELSSVLALLREKFPGVEFDLCVFECVQQSPASRPEVKKLAHVLRVAFDYRDPAPGNDWAIRSELLLPWLSSFAVKDYRTPQQRRAHRAAERQRDRERLPAKTLIGYWFLKLQFKLYRHLCKSLARRGVAVG